MKKNIRIIPRLDIKGPNVVKGVHLEGLRIIGRPEIFAQIYYEQGADELLYVDTVASLYGRNSLEDIIRRTADTIFIPLTVGGGLRSVDDMQRVLRAGADKVAINTAAINNKNLIVDGVKAFGSQCIIASIQARKIAEGKYECLTDNGREKTGIDVIEWAKRVVDLGAGEILLTSVDNEGTGRGYDIELTRSLAETLGVPIIASGGAGCSDHVFDAVQSGMADAVCIASIIHYRLLNYMERAEYPEEGNLGFLKRRISTIEVDRHLRKGIQPIMLRELKEYLAERGLCCRISGVN